MFRYSWNSLVRSLQTNVPHHHLLLADNISSWRGRAYPAVCNILELAARHALAIAGPSTQAAGTWCYIRALVVKRVAACVVSHGVAHTLRTGGVRRGGDTSHTGQTLKARLDEGAVIDGTCGSTATLLVKVEQRVNHGEVRPGLVATPLGGVSRIHYEVGIVVVATPIGQSVALVKFTTPQTIETCGTSVVGILDGGNESGTLAAGHRTVSRRTVVTRVGRGGKLRMGQIRTTLVNVTATGEDVSVACRYDPLG